MTHRIATFLSLFLFTAAATATPIFPPSVGGVYTSSILASAVVLDPAGEPLGPATASVGMVLEDGTLLVCAAAAPGDTVSVEYAVPNNSGRQKVSAYAYSLDGCGVDGNSPPSEPSENTAFVFFGPPGKPELGL